MTWEQIHDEQDDRWSIVAEETSDRAISSKYEGFEIVEKYVILEVVFEYLCELFFTSALSALCKTGWYFINIVARSSRLCWSSLKHIAEHAQRLRDIRRKYVNLFGNRTDRFYLLLISLFCYVTTRLMFTYFKINLKHSVCNIIVSAFHQPYEEWWLAHFAKIIDSDCRFIKCTIAINIFKLAKSIK